MESRDNNDSRSSRKIADLGRILIKEELQAKYQQIASILKVPSELRTSEQSSLLELSPDIVQRCEHNIKKVARSKSRSLEIADNLETLDTNCRKLADAVKNAQKLIVYTGAGISTAAAIPDYRGPNGIWTLKNKGIHLKANDLSDAEPTYTHMALFELMRRGIVKYVVSQNCDGLHVRSGIDRDKLSELHGNMYLELCPQCPNKEYMRVFDVTERTGMRKHATGRMCHACSSELCDTIVHFGEKGGMDAPYHWKRARAAAESSDMILCLGSSLKVLRSYACLWCMDRPVKRRPGIYIVNLQWTPKDSVAKLKVNGACDDVMLRIMSLLDIPVSAYTKLNDPIFLMAVPLREQETSSFNRKCLSQSVSSADNQSTKDCDASAKSELCQVSKLETGSQEAVDSSGWYGLGFRPGRSKKRKLT